VIWFIALYVLGKIALKNILKRVVVQGG